MKQNRVVLRGLLTASMIGSMALAGCSDPPRQTATSTREETTTSVPAMTPVPGMPGTVTTQTTRSQTTP